MLPLRTPTPAHTHAHAHAHTHTCVPWLTPAPCLCASLDTPQRVRAAIEPRTRTHTSHQRACLHASPLTPPDLDTKGIHEVRALAPRARARARSRAHALTRSRAPQVAARRFCLVAAGAPWPNHRSNSSKAHRCAPSFAQTTRSSRRCNSKPFFLNLCTPCAQLVLTPDPVAEQISENAEKLQSAPLPPKPASYLSHLHPPLAVAVGEISMMCACS